MMPITPGNLSIFLIMVILGGEIASSFQLPFSATPHGVQGALQCRPRDGILTENARVEGWKERGYTWPPSYEPDEEGWKKIFERRFAQLSRIDIGKSEDMYNRKYNGWLSAVTSAFVVPAFTDKGWEIRRVSDEVLEGLRKELKDGLEEGRTRLELGNEIIVEEGEGESQLPPLFIDLPEGKGEEVLEHYRGLHEDFCGQKLVGAKCYGLRVYRNGSRLLMHTDKPNTHVIASILHLGHDDDCEGWPIVIEDYEGNVNEVMMEPGDMLLYESAKLYHGRPRPLKGSWYCSIFSHYYPEDWDVENFHWESHYGVPPHWADFKQGEEERERASLEVVGTALNEPECEEGWEGLKESILWENRDIACR